MDTAKNIISLLAFFITFAPSSFAQVESLDSSQPFVLDTNSQLIELAKNTNDTTIVKEFLKKNPDYTTKGESGMNALEISYLWVNERVFWCIFDYILAQKDTLFIQNSTTLLGAIQTADTLLANRLLSLYGHKLSFQDRQDYINSFAEFCIGYNVENKYRSGVEVEEFRLNNTIDLDLKLAEIMTKHGFDFNEPDTMGQNIVFKCRHFPIVAKYFIENKIEINRLDNKKRTFLQCFIDDIARPLPYDIYEFDGLEEVNKFYSRKLELLKYYIGIGATVGENKVNGWKYLVELLKNGSNPYFRKYVFENYGC